MLDVMLIAHFTGVPGGRGNGRFRYLAERLSCENVAVEVVTSSFSHSTKNRKVVSDQDARDAGYALTMLSEPGYGSNVSLSRLYSHWVLGRNLARYLERRRKPDVIYCAVPSLEAAGVAASYARRHQVRLIVDIQDLWPEAFSMVFHVPVISDLVFSFMKHQADRIYSTADEIVAVSNTYANRALEVNAKCRQPIVAYLGTSLREFDRLAELNRLLEKPQDEIWLAYVGTIGRSYDLRSVVDALVLLRSRFNIRLIVMGDGPMRRALEDYAAQHCISTVYTGKLDYGKMVGILKECDMAVNPICKGSAASIINKVGDYAAAGLPVVNTQECEEYRRLLDGYSAGINCDTIEDVAEAISWLCEDSDRRFALGRNSRKLAEECFDRDRTYESIVRLIVEADRER